mmetsp:Transcript_5375/g.22015  ORF Transcript_5375/g.22015 Transcript_5375/m.22015 type:complete len:207 (+) Transcript_5375:561-1181(+)
MRSRRSRSLCSRVFLGLGPAATQSLPSSLLAFSPRSIPHHASTPSEPEAASEPKSSPSSSSSISSTSSISEIDEEGAGGADLRTGAGGGRASSSSSRSDSASAALSSMGESGSGLEVFAAFVSGSGLEASPGETGVFPGVFFFFFFLALFFFVAGVPFKSAASFKWTRSSSSSASRRSLSASANVHASLAHVCENIARATVFAAVS